MKRDWKLLNKQWLVSQISRYGGAWFRALNLVDKTMGKDAFPGHCDWNVAGNIMRP